MVQKEIIKVVSFEASIAYYVQSWQSMEAQPLHHFVTPTKLLSRDISYKLSIMLQTNLIVNNNNE